MKTLRLIAIAGVFLFLGACNNNTEEKNRESEINTDTIDTTATNNQQMSDTVRTDSTTNPVPSN
ncbi:hypothetical protein [Pedobacter sp. Leaf170]|uniref:hypothetical protein n=1 Tax=Pedobacter sp. Leaf170 TaxID=2876558 RepID=UPI001E401863|nr:hypothetical protein [Pedobacter sp. Leaf170]